MFVGSEAIVWILKSGTGKVGSVEAIAVLHITTSRDSRLVRRNQRALADIWTPNLSDEYQ